MNFIFKSKPKSPQELVKVVKEGIQKLDSNDGRKSSEKLLDDIAKNVVAMKQIMYEDGENTSSPEAIAQLSQEIYTNDLLYLLVVNLAKLEFETRKHVAQIFNNLVRRQVGARFPTVEYLCQNEKVMRSLVKGYEDPEIALNCGIILRECIRHEQLAKALLHDPSFYQFFDYAQLPTFDVASDAFATFKDLLTKNKALVASFLEESYDTFFQKYNSLLNSDNYVTKRVSLKLLGELLLDRSNFNSMTKYISDTENLKMTMNFMRDKSRNIQFEAFHVFKIFVANPNKPKPIFDILFKNKDKMIQFLDTFHTDRADDEQFNDEKLFLIKQIKAMEC